MPMKPCWVFATQPQWASKHPKLKFVPDNLNGLAELFEVRPSGPPGALTTQLFQLDPQRGFAIKLLLDVPRQLVPLKGDKEEVLARLFRFGGFGSLQCFDRTLAIGPHPLFKRKAIELTCHAAT